MKVDEPFTGFLWLAFALACHQDGQPFKAGICLGVAIMFTLCWLCTWVETKKASSS